MTAYVRAYRCRTSVQEDFGRARRHLAEALAVLRCLDLEGCDVAYLHPQLLRQVKEALKELDAFGRFVLVVDAGAVKKAGGRPRKAQA
jgi:hypothetical protein